MPVYLCAGRTWTFQGGPQALEHTVEKQIVMLGVQTYPILKNNVAAATTERKLSRSSRPKVQILMRNRRRDDQPDYVNLYFQWEVFRVVSRILGAIICGLIVLGWFIVNAVAPDYGVDYLLWAFASLIMGVFVLVIVQIYLWCRKRPDPMKGWAPPGALPNPPGNDWFDSSGNRLWKRVGDHWERTTTLER